MLKVCGGDNGGGGDGGDDSGGGGDGGGGGGVSQFDSYLVVSVKYSTFFFTFH